MRYFFALIVIALISQSCIDPVEPEFQYVENVLFVEGLASTAEGTSFVSIRQASTEFGIYQTSFVEGASVSVANADTGVQTPFLQDRESYVAPTDFVVNPGESYKLIADLPDGRRIESNAESTVDAVQIDDVQINYESELYFDEELERNIPGHQMRVDFLDPVNVPNYYYFTYRLLEDLKFCERCYDGILRDGSCYRPPGFRNFPDYYDYQCDTECWKIRFPESIILYDDQFSDGLTIENFYVDNLPLYTRTDALVELQLWTLSEEAYRYYKVLKDLVDNNIGFNAPPPAPLVGNMRNVLDDEDFVFGRFSVAAASTTAVFIERETLTDLPIEPILPVVFEPTLNSPYPPPATVLAPCNESRYRTAIKPENWIDNE